MNTVRVVKLFDNNPVLLASEKGEELCAKIKDVIKRFGSVKVNFAGYEFLSSTFLNRAFGQLCIDMNWGTEKFRKNVKVMGLDDDDIIDLEVAVNNAQLRRKLIKKGVTDLKEYFDSRLPA